MALTCGIVGLPNVGKSTIFNALTGASAASSNFPFCTIDKNVGVVSVPDSRLGEIAARLHPVEVTPTTVRFTDIAGLVKGASHGEGLGNQFLGHIRNTHVIVHVVRCFDDPTVVHVEGELNPAHDVGIVETELLLADLDVVSRRHESVTKASKAQKTKSIELETLSRLKEALEAGHTAATLDLSSEEIQSIQDLNLLTIQPVVFVANISEADLKNPGACKAYVRLEHYAHDRGTQVIPICGTVEAEIGQLPVEEREVFLQSMELQESGLNHLIRVCYKLLGLVTFFTTDNQKLRAWTVAKGSSAVMAAGVIHSDFERGFVKSEVYHVNDLVALGSEHEIRAKGKARIEGREYVVQDGDVMHFRFNV